MEKYYIVTFKNTHEAMKAESEMNKNKLKVIVMPTPTYITKSCGISLKIDIKDYDNLNKIINENKVAHKNVYLKENNNYSLVN